MKIVSKIYKNKCYMIVPIADIRAWPVYISKLLANYNNGAFRALENLDSATVYYEDTTTVGIGIEIPIEGIISTNRRQMSAALIANRVYEIDEDEFTILNIN